METWNYVVAFSSRRYEGISQTSGWASSRPTSWSASSRLNSSGKPRVSLLSRPSTPALSKRLLPSKSDVKSCSSPRVSFRPRESSVKSAKGWLFKANDASLRSGPSSSMMLLPLPFWLPELRMYSPAKKYTDVYRRRIKRYLTKSITDSYRFTNPTRKEKMFPRL